MSRVKPSLLALSLLTAAAVSAAVPAAVEAQEIAHSSACSPQGSDSYPVGDSILFLYRQPDVAPPPPVIPKLPIQAYPPCIGVTLRADQVSGRPPLVVTWEGPEGETWSGDTVTVDTGTLETGVHTYTLTVANDDGQLVRAMNLWVPKLEPALPAPVPDLAPSPDLEVSFAAQGPGAHEWRWDFGDGNVTPWQATCDYSTSTAVHTYAEAGTYSVVAYARNCRDGAVASQPLVLEVGGGI